MAEGNLTVCHPERGRWDLSPVDAKIIRCFCHMLTIPRLLREGENEAEATREFAFFLKEFVGKHGKTLRSLQRQGVNISANLGERDFRPETIKKLIALLRPSPQNKELLWGKYIGDIRESVRDLVHAHLRKEGSYSRLAKKTKTYVWLIQNMLFSKNGDNGVIMPDLSQWDRMSRVIKVEPERSYAIWLRDMRIHLRKKGLNPLGAEVQTLFSEHGVVCEQWIRGKDRPPVFQTMGKLALGKFLWSVRNGELHPWSMVEKLCDALNLPEKRRRVLQFAHRLTETSARASPLFEYWPWLKERMSQLLEYFDDYTEDEQSSLSSLPGFIDIGLEEAPEFEDYRWFWYWDRWKKQLSIVIQEAIANGIPLEKTLEQSEKTMAEVHVSVQTHQARVIHEIFKHNDARKSSPHRSGRSRESGSSPYLPRSRG